MPLIKNQEIRTKLKENKLNKERISQMMYEKNAIPINAFMVDNLILNK